MMSASTFTSESSSSSRAPKKGSITSSTSIKLKRAIQRKEIFELSSEMKEPIPCGLYSLIKVKENDSDTYHTYIRLLIEKESVHAGFYQMYLKNQTTIFAAGECFFDNHGNLFAWSNHTGHFLHLFTDKNLETMNILPMDKFYPYQVWEEAKKALTWADEKKRISALESADDSKAESTLKESKLERITASKEIKTEEDLYENGQHVPSTSFYTTAKKFGEVIGKEISTAEEALFKTDPVPVLAKPRKDKLPLSEKRRKAKPPLPLATTPLDSTADMMRAMTIVHSAEPDVSAPPSQPSTDLPGMTVETELTSEPSLMRSMPSSGPTVTIDFEENVQAPAPESKGCCVIL